MSSRCLSLVLLLFAALGVHAAERELRVCADPDNLPYSHEDRTGFENRIAEVIASEMGARLAYEWQPLRRGFVRKTAGAGLCEVFIGVPAGFERVLTTRPYYRSGYVFVWRSGTPWLASFDAPGLAERRIGVQLVGDDLAATPPGHALAIKGAVRRVRGYTIYGDGPTGQRMVADLAAAALDAGVAWGPQVLYFAARSGTPMEWHWAQAPPELAGMPFEFSIAVGVKRGEKALRDEIDAILQKRRGDIEAILDAYQVPRLPIPPRRPS
jgi:mxaJ protein